MITRTFDLEKKGGTYNMTGTIVRNFLVTVNCFP